MTPFPKALAAISLSSVLTAQLASAVSTSTVPLGYVTYTAKGLSDTTLGVPVHRKPLFVGTVETISTSGGAADKEALITVDATPGWTPGDLVPTPSPPPPAAPTPPDKEAYYVLICSGDGGMPEDETYVGRYYEVVANGSNTLTLFTGVEDISSAVVAGTQIKLIPFWTLDTLFPAGEGVHPSQNFGTLNSQVLLPDTATAGINLANSSTFYYYDGSIGVFPDAAWLRAGNGPTNDWGKQPLAPDVSFIIRHTIAGDTTITPMGDVFTTPFKTPLNVLTGGLNQDNAVFLSVPLDVTLAESQLFESGAIAGNPTFNAANSDQLLVFDATAVAQNKANSATYFYYTGAALGGPGWRKAGDPATIVNSDVVFSLTSQVIIRRYGVGQPAGSTIWTMVPAFLSTLNN